VLRWEKGAGVRGRGEGRVPEEGEVRPNKTKWIRSSHSPHHNTHTHTHTHTLTLNPKQGKMQAILALQEREHAVQAGASTTLIVV
jgi:hypothetical protein